MLDLFKSRKFQVALVGLLAVLGGHYGLSADYTSVIDPILSLLVGIFVGKPTPTVEAPAE